MRFWVGLALGVFAASSVCADTDYRCLTACVNDGKPSSTCMKTCTYSPVRSLSPDTVSTKPEGHKQFAPMFSNDGRLLTPAAATKKSQDENYVCIYSCMQAGSEYQYCRDSCVVKPMDTEKSQGGAVPRLDRGMTGNYNHPEYYNRVQ